MKTAGGTLQYHEVLVIRLLDHEMLVFYTSNRLVEALV